MRLSSKSELNKQILWECYKWKELKINTYSIIRADYD